MYALDPLTLDPLLYFFGSPPCYFLALPITRCIFTLFGSRWYNSTFIAWSLNYTIVVRGSPAEMGGE